MIRTIPVQLLEVMVVMALMVSSVAAADEERFREREQDWRNGAIVYQVLVDRFVPSGNLEAKRHLYPAPKVLRDWSEQARKGVYLEEQKLNSQELDFWGGDLQSLSTRIDYIAELGADALYLNPIHLGYTNHKYDALDFMEISPEYGTRSDFRRLAEQVHGHGMKLVMDGVFNHMGRNSPRFRDAFSNPESPWRDWFYIGTEYAGGARVWTGFQNLPELNIENPAVRDYLFAAPDSVVRSYLRDGADGWRLDTAYELGRPFLSALTASAHAEKPDSVIIGEIVNYPGEWLRSMDGVMNFTFRKIIYSLVREEIPPALAARMTAEAIADAGIEAMLKSWTLLDNHDVPRIATELPDTATRRMAQVLQFTLPGAPNLYYGSELGMPGGTDPENRSPMRWDLVSADNPELAWVRTLIELHKQHRALRIGDYRPVISDRLYAFERRTDRVLETVVVLVNPANEAVTETVLVKNADLMDAMPMADLLAPAGAEPFVNMSAGTLRVTLPAWSFVILQPAVPDLGGYNRYKRVP
jgi:glycosidase